MSTVQTSSREKNWTKEETMELITVITSSEWQEKFTKGKKSHTVIYSDIVQLLSRNCDGKSAKSKWDSVKKEYRSIKKSLKTGDAAPMWPFWEVMKRFMEPRPMENNGLVMDSISFEINDDSSDQDENVDPNPSNNVSHSSSNVAQSENESDASSTSSRSVPGPRNPRLDRKRKREDFESSFQRYMEDQQLESEENRKVNGQLLNLLGTLITAVERQNTRPVIVLESQQPSST